MSEQGERPGPRTEQQLDWWRQLYDAGASDTGGAEGGDTLDDRFASVTRTVGAGRTSGGATGRRGGAGPPQEPAEPVVPARPAEAAEPVDPAEVTTSADAERSPAGEEPGQSPGLGWPATDSLDPWHLGPTYPEPPGMDGTDPADLPDPGGPDPAAELADWPAAPANTPPTQVGRSVPESASEPAEPPVAEQTATEPISEPAAVPERAPGPWTPRSAAASAEPYAPEPGAASDTADAGAPEQPAAPEAPEAPPVRRPEPLGPPATPHPEELAETVPDTVLDGARHGRLALRTVSLRGDTARERSEPRREAVCTTRFGQGADALLLVAVATGAGPAEVAGAAARDACHAIASAIGRSHARLAEDIAAGRRGALKSGLQRLTDRSHGKLLPVPEDRPSAEGTDVHAPGLRCLLLPADPGCSTRVLFGIGGGGFFRLRAGVWQDIEPSVAPPPERTDPAPDVTAPPATRRTADAATGTTTAPGADPRATMHLGFPAPVTPEQPPPEPFRTEPARPQPFLFRASTARPGDTLLLASAGLAEPLREAPHFAERLAARWSGTRSAPELAAFLTEVQPRPQDPHGADRTAAAVWEDDEGTP